MDYQKRLLKFLRDYDGVFTCDDVAAIWKRSVYDVRAAALNLKTARKIKQTAGVLSLR